MEKTAFSFKELKIPEKFNAAGQEYEVIVCKTDADFVMRTGAEDAFGATLKLKKQVFINLELHIRQGASIDQIRETAYHEFGHCLFEESGLSACTSSELEEIIVDLYSKYIKTIKTGVRK